jgi:DNA-binding XRE family transcriptional regulator
METKEFKTIRSELGLTQQQLADLLEVQRNTVARYETGVLTIPKTVELAVRNLHCQKKKKAAKS